MSRYQRERRASHPFLVSVCGEGIRGDSEGAGRGLSETLGSNSFSLWYPGEPPGVWN